jgi:hypothetical protein
MSCANAANAKQVRTSVRTVSGIRFIFSFMVCLCTPPTKDWLFSCSFSLADAEIEVAKSGKLMRDGKLGAVPTVKN